MKQIVAVKFPRTSRPYLFIAKGIELNINDFVVVSTTKGLQFGEVIKTNIEETNRILSNVVRKASKEDNQVNEENKKLEKEALEVMREVVEQEKKPMHIVDARYSFDREMLTFTFFAENRVDFRDLLKILAKTFKTRIELLQIGVRDKAREVGGVGQCGQELCCARFLNKTENISINMAKNQELALNPNKINGVCGRLLCCLSYENEFYRDCKKRMPKKGERVETKKGTGKVIKLDCPKMTFTIETEQGGLEEIECKDGKD